MEIAKQHAFELLTALGCAVTDIPVANSLEAKSPHPRRADLRAVDSSASYVVEVKHKTDDVAFYRNHAQRLASGEVVARSGPLWRNNRIDAILKDGRDQIDKTPTSRNDFRLIWFFADGIDRVLHRKRVFASFYGFVQLLALAPPAEHIVDCFYFDFSAAWSMRSVDAMVLTDGIDISLCLNEFSRNITTFRESGICKQLTDAIVDPVRLRNDKRILAIYRDDLSRKCEARVLDELQTMTGVRYTTLRPNQDSATVLATTRNSSWQWHD